MGFQQHPATPGHAAIRENSAANPAEIRRLVRDQKFARFRACWLGRMCFKASSTLGSHSFPQGIGSPVWMSSAPVPIFVNIDFDSRKPRKDFRWKRQVCAIATRRR